MQVSDGRFPLVASLRRLRTTLRSGAMECGLTLTTTRDAQEILAARQLRHSVFVDEMGAQPPNALAQTLEGDRFDAQSDHLILRDPARADLGVVATLRCGPGTGYTEQEFDLSRLKASGRRLGEAGRACLHPAYRGGLAGLLLFKGLLQALHRHGVQVAVGTASFPGADFAAHLPALRALQQEAAAPDAIRPLAHGQGAVQVEGKVPRAAMAGVPALIKTYVRAGAQVGAGAYVDRAFNTTDVCIVLDLARVKVPEWAR